MHFVEYDSVRSASDNLPQSHPLSPINLHYHSSLLQVSNAAEKGPRTGLAASLLGFRDASSSSLLMRPDATVMHSF